MSRADIDEAFDSRIEPWAPQLPGCTGACLQGRRPCLHPEQCYPEKPVFSRNGCLIIFVLAFLLWSALIGFVLGVIGIFR